MPSIIWQLPAPRLTAGWPETQVLHLFQTSPSPPNSAPALPSSSRNPRIGEPQARGRGVVVKVLWEYGEKGTLQQHGVTQRPHRSSQEQV